MAVALDMQSADFERRFQALLAAKRESSADVDLAVADIIEDVRQRGDAALAELSLRFDRVEIGRLGLRISAAEVDTAIAACEKAALEALELLSSVVYLGSLDLLCLSSGIPSFSAWAMGLM